jgi:hypothetical protein
VLLAREDAALDAQLLDAAHTVLSDHIEWYDGVLAKVTGLCVCVCICVCVYVYVCVCVCERERERERERDCASVCLPA